MLKGTVLGLAMLAAPAVTSAQEVCNCEDAFQPMNVHYVLGSLEGQLIMADELESNVWQLLWFEPGPIYDDEVLSRDVFVALEVRPAVPGPLPTALGPRYTGIFVEADILYSFVEIELWVSETVAESQLPLE